jgi:signal transduction histidine kinase
MSERDESKLLHLIAQTAVDLTGASFAAFTLRPINEQGQLLVPSEGHLFHLAAVIGVTKEQEELFQRMPLGGEGLLAPIFRHGVAVRIADATQFQAQAQKEQEQRKKQKNKDPLGQRDEARRAAFAYVHGQVPSDQLQAVGMPRGHPIIRSFLGAPLLDRNHEVRGGLLLGHSEPGHFSAEDETLLMGLASQAAVAVENARLYHHLQMRAQELDAIFQSIADGVTLVDEHGHILRENVRARRLRDQLKQCPDGQAMLDTMLYHPACEVLAGKPMRDTAVSIALDSEGQGQREYIVNASPLYQAASYYEQNGNEDHYDFSSISGAIVVWHDVTEARRLLHERQERAAMESRLALLQLILDELPTSVYLVYGREARLVLANKAARTVWGAVWPTDMPMQEFLERNRIRVFKGDGQSLPLEQLATLRAVQRGETTYQQQETIRHSDGKSLPVQVNAIALDTSKFNVALPYTNKDGHNGPEPAAIVVHQDVTALKEAEYLKDEFIGIAAHELRNPLAVLHGCAQTLIVQTARGKGPELSIWQKEAIQDIDQATGRLVELTEDLLDVTRLQGGRLELNINAGDLVSLTRRVVQRLQPTVDSKHPFIMHSEVEFLVAQIDTRRVEQILTNLLVNAVKYSPDGGSIDIYLSEDKENRQALLSVKDTGIGIPAYQQGRIFGRFIRADNAQDIGGTGLGLYLCRELVERHGGRIWFESVEGKGSTFYVALPLADLT